MLPTDSKQECTGKVLEAKPMINKPKHPHSERTLQTAAQKAESLSDPEKKKIYYREIGKKEKSLMTHICLIVMSNPHQLQAQQERGINRQVNSISIDSR